MPKHSTALKQQPHGGQITASLRQTKLPALHSDTKWMRHARVAQAERPILFQGFLLRSNTSQLPTRQQAELLQCTQGALTQPPQPSALVGRIMPLCACLVLIAAHTPLLTTRWCCCYHSRAQAHHHHGHIVRAAHLHCCLRQSLSNLGAISVLACCLAQLSHALIIQAATPSPCLLSKQAI